MKRGVDAISKLRVRTAVMLEVVANPHSWPRLLVERGNNEGFVSGCCLGNGCLLGCQFFIP